MGPMPPPPLSQDGAQAGMSPPRHSLVSRGAVATQGADHGPRLRGAGLVQTRMLQPGEGVGQDRMPLRRAIQLQRPRSLCVEALDFPGGADGGRCECG